MGPLRERSGEQSKRRERIAKAWALQWGRCANAAESWNESSAVVFVDLLQWGRCANAAERRLAHAIDQVERLASMGPLRERSGEAEGTRPRLRAGRASMG